MWETKLLVIPDLYISFCPPHFKMLNLGQMLADKKETKKHYSNLYKYQEITEEVANR